MKWLLYNLTATTKSGGMETTVWALARALARAGEEVRVIGGASERPLPLAASGIEVTTYPFRGRKSFPDLGSRARKLMERLSFAKNAGQDLARSPWDRLLIFKTYDIGPALWARRRHGGWAGLYSGGVEAYPASGMLARRLDYRACFSRFNAQRTSRAVGADFAVNYPGVDLEKFKPVTPDPDLARAAGVEPGDEVLVMAVRLVGWKGVQDAVAALKILAPGRQRLKLLVAGEGPFRPELEKQIAHAGLTQRVRLLGYLDPDRLAGFYALGKLALFPSRGEEAFGLSIAEAMACGLPVVAADQGGIPEVVGDEAGLLTPPKDPAALARAVERLLSDSGLWDSCREKARARVEALFTWQACIARMG